MEVSSSRSIESVLIGDLGRVEIWTFTQEAISEGRADHTWGKTYIQGAVTFIPRIIWPNRPEAMAEVITDMIYGEGTHAAKREKTARATGLIGEAYINFGWPFMIVAMFVYGVFIRAATSWAENTPDNVAKSFIGPLVTMLGMNIFVWDCALIVFNTFNFLLPTYIIYRLAMPKYSPMLSDEQYYSESIAYNSM